MNCRPTLLAFLLVFLSTSIRSQETVCEGSPCTSNDFIIDSFFIGDENGTPFGPGYCEPNTTVNAFLWLNFSANATADRYDLYIHFNLYVDGQFVGTVDECFYEGQSIPTNVTLNTHSFSWECGSEVVLEDLYMSWQTNNNGDCGCAQSHCYSNPTVVVLAPLIANFVFDPSCLTAYTIDFLSTTAGGTPPYSYLWDFGDGQTSTEENPTHTYDSTGPYTITLLVHDAENTDYQSYEVLEFDSNIPPEINAPTDMNIEGCDLSSIPQAIYSETPTEISESDFNDLGGSLLLGNDLVSLTYQDYYSGVCPINIIRTFTLIDSCNNVESSEQNITISDAVIPTASNPIPINLNCNNDIPSPDINVVTDEADNCSIPMVAFVSDVSDNLSCPETITRTYSITDACGNFIEVYQLIIIEDDNLPTASNPADINISCNDDIPSPDISVVTDEADNCSTPIVAFVSDVSDNMSCPETITRTYSITDACDNSIVVTQKIIINDITPPTAFGPEDISIQCIEDLPDPDIDMITDVTDNCSLPTVNFVSDVSNFQSCNETITRTYSITDSCGNLTLVTQSIFVIDDIPPTASNPDPIILECNGNIPAPDVNLVIDEADNCSIPLVTFISDISNGECPEIIMRTYEIRDNCNNSIYVTQEIIYEDTTSPELLTPFNENITVTCDNIPVVPNLEFFDTCSADLSITFNQTDTNADNLVDYDIIREWIVEDDCGNVNYFTQTIRVLINNCLVSSCNSCGTNDDTIPPTASNPPDLTVSCVNSIPEPDVNIVTDEADNCLPPIVEFVSETVSFDCFEKVIRIYRVTDECGNYIDVSHTINVIDDIDPTASNPVDINVQCVDDIPVPDINVVTDELDNCSTPVVAFVSDISNNSCSDKITRTYSVTDSCGNSIMVEQSINVNDDQPPTASNPADFNISCIGDIPTPNENVVTDETDNCSTPTVAFVSDVSDNLSCPETITRTYSVTDECGNSIEVNQSIIIEDDILPTASNPANINISCVDDIPTPNINVVTDEADNCATPTVTFVSDVSDNLSCPETITRTYSITDECGNSIEVIQLIIIEDDILPTATNPADINISCLDDIPSPNINVVTDEADNCSTPAVDFVSDMSDNQSCLETITRTYSVTDVCGNSIVVTQSIYIIDNDPPELASKLESQIYITCEEIPEVPSLDFTDNCTTSIDVTFDEVFNQTDNLNFEIQRTWVATDLCGNQSTYNQSIYVNRTTESITQYVQLCIDDDPLNLNSLVPYQEVLNTNILINEWDSDTIELLENGIFDPGSVRLGDYEFTKMTNNDCAMYTTIYINVHDDCLNKSCVESTDDITISKMVTPNNDGFNDFFDVGFILNEESSENCDVFINVQIYNRWGTKIFESHNYNNDWAGIANSSSASDSGFLPTGTYYYIVDLVNSGLKSVQGYIYLGTE